MEEERLHGDFVGRRDLVVIGASAGGVEVLIRVVRGLPADLRAAICIVLHIAPGSPSMLAHILGRAGSSLAGPHATASGYGKGRFSSRRLISI